MEIPQQGRPLREICHGNVAVAASRRKKLPIGARGGNGRLASDGVVAATFRSLARAVLLDSHRIPLEFVSWTFRCDVFFLPT